MGSEGAQAGADAPAGVEPVVVGTHARLLEHSGDDPYVRWGVPDPLPGLALALPGGAVAVERVGGRRHGFVLWPVPGAADQSGALRRLLRHLEEGGHRARTGATGLSVPQQHAAVLADLYRLGAGGDWEWMWTTRAPAAQPGEDRLIELDDAHDAEEITAFSVLHNARGEGHAGTGAAERWLAVRDAAGALVAVGAMQRLPSGLPHLAGIVTHDRHRGTGLGAAVTAGLTRLALSQAPACTLGMYSDNAVARRVYHRLGYATAHAWCSRQVLPR